MVGWCSHSVGVASHHLFPVAVDAHLLAQSRCRLRCGRDSARANSEAAWNACRCHCCRPEQHTRGNRRSRWHCQSMRHCWRLHHAHVARPQCSRFGAALFRECGNRQGPAETTSEDRETSGRARRGQRVHHSQHSASMRKPGRKSSDMGSPQEEYCASGREWIS